MQVICQDDLSRTRDDNRGTSLIFRLICCLALAPAAASGQSTPVAAGLAPAQPPAAVQREVGQSVLQELRDGNLEQALKVLEPAGEWAIPISLVDDDFVSQACAGVHRALAQLDPEAQYNLLYKWTFAGDSPKRIRQLTAQVPTVAPPAEFGRALGERPRGNSFPVSSIGSVRGIFSTGWSLVVAARESGKLKRLTTELAAMVDQKIPGAELLLSLARIADGRGEMSHVARHLSDRLLQVQAGPRPAVPGQTTIDRVTLLLAIAALNHQALCPLGEQLLGKLLASTEGQAAPAIRPFLRQAQATACLLSAGDGDSNRVASAIAAPWKYWIAVSAGSGERNAGRQMSASWMAHEDHILHLSGSSHDTLLFRYPLTGEFQFQCETQLGGQFETDGSLSYGGLSFQATGTNGDFLVRDDLGNLIGKRYCHFSHWPTGEMFHRVSIASTASSASMLVDLHPMWVDRSGFQASPWLGLTSPGECRPVFRNFKLTGHPVIPRVVRLSDNDLLRGWQAQSWGNVSSLPSSIESDWSIAKGQIEVRNVKSETLQKPDAVSKMIEQQLLSYARPLQSGETIRYEFFYEAGVAEIHPAVGRVGFLLEPDGVRIHWMTAGNEWTSLAMNNTVVEPLCRRGPRPLPLIANDWNRLSIQRTEQAVILSLNEVAIYQRPIDWIDDQRFGLYRHDVSKSVKVRNVEFTGDWPETVPAEFLANPTATIGEPTTTMAQRHAVNQIIQEDLLASNVFAIRRRSLAMPASDRFEFLSQWVLPGSNHPGFRLAGDFTQTQPIVAQTEGSDGDSQSGGQIVSPVYDWLDAAKELGRLADCQKLVEGVAVPDTGSERRAQIALMLLLSLEQGDEAGATANFEKLYTLLRTATDDQWPELLVIDRSVHRFLENPLVGKFIADLRALKAQQARPWRNKLWQGHIASLLARGSLSNSAKGEANPDSSSELQDWICVTAATSATRGQGHPIPRWRRSEGKVVKVSSHDEDYLFYRSPLGGNFEVECDVLDMTQMMTAGSYLGPRFDTRNLDQGTFRAIGPNEVIVPPFTSFVHRVHVRSALRDGTRTISFNGRVYKTEKLAEHRDPWIAIRCAGRNQGGVLDFRITGSPRVLDVVPLSDSRELTGWIPYDDEPVPHEKYGWTHVDDPDSTGWIVGHPNPGLDGVLTEGLLRYQRPLVEDGSIAYEFFYDPDKFETHPALDRLAFILDRSGIREHWIGDGRYDRTEWNPKNIADIPDCRCGPPELPLVANDWNRLKLIFIGSTVAIELNDRPVYQRKLEPSNLRTFGLFHFLGKTAVRVRNAVMRGNWPKTVPPVTGQELVEKTVDLLEADLARLTSVFAHDFQKNAAPDKYFKTPAPSNTVGVSRSPRGVQITQHSVGPHAGVNLHPRFTLCGDFDIVAGFAGLRIEGTGDSGIMLNATLEEGLKHEYRALRWRTSQGNQDLHQSLGLVRSDGGRAYVGNSIPFEAINGRIRLARRGDRVYYLFAEEDSEHFFLFGSEPASAAETAIDGIFLHSYCNGVGLSQVNWTKLVMKAERIKWHSQTPQAPQELLSVMRADGKGLRNIAAPKSVGFLSVGAPEWSADGRKIVMQMSNGAPASARVFVVNADGTNLQDLGPGQLPSFSRDGNNIVCTVLGTGIVTMKSDGTERQTISASGWGAEWSPDGKSIAYAEDGNITLRDANTGITRKLLQGDAAARYGSVINLGWSHDSRSIAFKAERQDLARQELTLVELDSPDKLLVLHPNARAINQDITFSPDNQRVIVSIQKLNRPESTLYSLSCKQSGPSQPFPVALADHRLTGCDWSHDGKSIAITSQYSPQYIEWITGPVSSPVAR